MPNHLNWPQLITSMLACWLLGYFAGIGMFNTLLDFIPKRKKATKKLLSLPNRPKNVRRKQLNKNYNQIVAKNH